MLIPSDIVTDNDPDSLLEGVQGQVMNVQLHLFGGPIEVTVKFKRALCENRMYISEDEGDEWTEIYEPHELQLDDDWKPESWAALLFGRRWHSTYQLENPLDQEELCCVKDCAQNQTTTAWFNV